ncbi:hypothetical protein DP067_01195 [Mycoplasmopsis anatis]|uniref:Replicative helicase loading/DNA remodeling protein DnaB N-terminal winged helix domain-containing protein n=1 Tax=Mycoplasmopsis anatis 1340 TaxID=1034808 RepID=F9QEH7_9BACT|nr:hypothetical protein [Mycoplasmopsis anatis]AWX69988.1 hypothetical protein DP067_01195 [Mycoplasmopsis anatis]EGS28827.1 hypothetical protein GIG_03984 [Mycoplasmopsis anatis 1340]VEU73582.1 DnaD domain-containing protein [Mycoplasmopsis anatis]
MDANSKLIYSFFRIYRGEQIASEDLRNLRLFYTSFLGATTVLLYEFLYDLIFNKDKYDSTFTYDTLSLYLNISMDELNEARQKLESVSLIETHSDSKESRTIFVLFKPLSSAQMIKNAFIPRLIKNNIGEVNYERVVNLTNNNTFKGNETLVNISASFHEMFSLQSETKSKVTELLVQAGAQIKENTSKVWDSSKSYQTQFEIGVIKNSNHYKATKELTCEEFYCQLTNTFNLQDSVREKIIKLNSILNLSKVTNLAMLYVYLENNDKVDFRKTIKLLNEIKYNNYIIDDETCEKYLHGKFKNDIQLVDAFIKMCSLMNE